MELMKYIKFFNEITTKDLPAVGGKNASLGEMISTLTQQGLRVPEGFAITVDGYWDFLNHNKLVPELKKIIGSDTELNDVTKLREVGKKLRSLIENGEVPTALVDEIVQGYKKLNSLYGQECDVAVRSSATAEDLPGASFAGQQETFLNVKGEQQLIESYRKCCASLFTDRAIMYRIEKGFDHFKVGLSVGVQKMIRSDKGCAGVMFTLDTETGFRDMIMIEASYGLGETVVKGLVTPDEYAVFKPTLAKGFKPIVRKKLGNKDIKLVYGEHGSGTEQQSVHDNDRAHFCLKDEQILELSRYGTVIEKHYSTINKVSTPMDIEWAVDGIDGKLYIIQARPETVHSFEKKAHELTQYVLKNEQNAQPVVTGEAIGQSIAQGTVRVISSINDVTTFNEGDVLVTSMTDPDWVPLMKKASAIITDRGGRTCHAAIVSRELGIVAVVGARNATNELRDGDKVTIDCSAGKTGAVYKGIIPFEVMRIDVGSLPSLPVDVMVNIADPDQAMARSFLPVSGVGLARIEFIMGNLIKIHPMAACEPEKVTDAAILKTVNNLAVSYGDPQSYVVNRLAESVGMIAAAFYPHPVIVRTSDFKTNEYRNLIGGSYFEPEESNPMLGLRGASRYYSSLYSPAFALECAALKKVRDEMGFENVQIMIPFVRTCDEAHKVIELLSDHGLNRGHKGLKIIMMCEVPANVILIDKFLQYFDGISIGSNDLTQMVLAVDRDSELLSNLFDEQDPAVMNMMKQAIEATERHEKYSGICGQAPSDHPEIARFLIECGIDSISLNVDSVMPFIYSLANNQ